MGDYSNDPVKLEQFAHSAAAEFGLRDVTLSLLNVSENATFLVNDRDGGKSVEHR